MRLQRVYFKILEVMIPDLLSQIITSNVTVLFNAASHYIIIIIYLFIYQL